MSSKHVVVAISGASRSIYGIRCLQILREISDVVAHLVVTPSAKSTIAVQTKISIQEKETLENDVHRRRVIGAAIASGS